MHFPPSFSFVLVTSMAWGSELEQRPAPETTATYTRVGMRTAHDHEALGDAGAVAVNRSDPLTGGPIDPTLGIVTIVLEHKDRGAAPAGGARRSVHIGFASPESRETVRMADASTKQKYARAALANRTITGRPALAP